MCGTVHCLCFHSTSTAHYPNLPLQHTSTLSSLIWAGMPRTKASSGSTLQILCSLSVWYTKREYNMSGHSLEQECHKHGAGNGSTVREGCEAAQTRAKHAPPGTHSNNKSTGLCDARAQWFITQQWFVIQEHWELKHKSTAVCNL